ncbi:DUF2310 family Zn-ribbon-containing protein [Chitinimonas sp.]|uniref:DUF2310 family Zn-ribbon-containing protein n=1 Tax=Chitinimonas sp. TaxID=1934313 RepID=UPI0035B2388D
MRVYRLEFVAAGRTLDDDEIELISALLGTLRMNGQIYGREFPFYRAGEAVCAQVMVPESGALDTNHRGRYVARDYERLRVARVQVSHVDLGSELDSQPACQCQAPSAYLLSTNYLAIVSPIDCLDCGGAVPLYRFAPFASGEYSELISWQSDYQSCDHLQMNCSTLVRAGMREISRLDSALSRRGLDYAAQLAAGCGRPVYYYLYRYGARSLRQERARRCPGCGGEWLLDTPIRCFDFKCDNCRLLSNIAWNVRDGA